ncbi:MAG: nucleoside hydrolase [Clostridiales bacterium]|nr:nucleoside hydrolase [Clostridiales bacterium]
MKAFAFTVPEKKKIRVIVHTDCKNEADDQFALAHHLMTQKFDVRGIVAGHFALNPSYGKEGSAKASYDEINLILELMGLEGKHPVFLGSPLPIDDEMTPRPSEGAQFIIDEAMREDERPLFVVFQGAITDLACAYLMQPLIAQKLTAVWIGGGEWPHGDGEFNLANDIKAANVVFSSDIPLWQIPKNVYKQMAVSLAELQVRVAPYGKIGEYLFRQMVEYNDQLADFGGDWPHGESWGLGDQGTVTVLLEEMQSSNFELKPAPRFADDMSYIHGQQAREIRVYHTLNARLTMEDFYAKLKICFPECDSQ